MTRSASQLVSTQCLAACCEADPDAWRRFVEASSPVIYSVVRRVVRPGSTVDVDDAVQEVFLRLFAREFRLLRTFNPERSSLATFLRVVASSTAIDLLRRQKTMPSSPEPDALIAAAGEDDWPEIDLDLGELTDRQRLILRLLFHAQMDVRDVARALGITEQTVRSAKHKALERLRTTYRQPEVDTHPARIAGDAAASDRV